MPLIAMQAALPVSVPSKFSSSVIPGVRAALPVMTPAVARSFAVFGFKVVQLSLNTGGTSIAPKTTGVTQRTGG